MSAALMGLHARDVALLGPFEVITPVGSYMPYRVVCKQDHRREVAACQMRKDAYMVCAILNDVCSRTPQTHRHVGPDDTCAECGRNFRDEIHERLTGAA
jgi:hypothetical protein